MFLDAFETELKIGDTITYSTKSRFVIGKIEKLMKCTNSSVPFAFDNALIECEKISGDGTLPRKSVVVYCGNLLKLK